MAETPWNNLENQNNSSLSVKDIIKATLNGEKDLQNKILARYESEWLKVEAKEELAKVLNTFKKEIRELNKKSELEYNSTIGETKKWLDWLKWEMEQENVEKSEFKKLTIDELASKLNTNYEITDKLAELNDDISDFDRVKNKLSNIENYDEFTQMVSNLWNEKLEDKAYSLFSKVIINDDFNIILEQNEWLPTNKDDLLDIIDLLEDEWLFNEKIESYNEIKTIKNININELTEIWEIKYIINKTEELLNSDWLTNKNKQLLQKRLIDFQTKKDFINKQEIEKSKLTIQENAEIIKNKSEENAEIIKNKLEKKDIVLEKIKDKIRETELNTIKSLVNIDSGLASIVEWIINWKNIDIKKEKFNELIVKFENPSYFHNFINKAKESSNYKEVYNFMKQLSTVSSWIKQLLTTIELPEQPEDFVAENMANMALGIEWAEMNSEWEYIWPDWEKIEIDWDIAKMWVFSENGFSLNSWSVDMSDLKAKNNELKLDFDELSETAWKLYKLKNIQFQISKLWDNKEKIQDLLNENWFNTIDDLKQEINLLEEDYNGKKEDYLEKRNTIKEEFLKSIKEVKEKEKKQKETLKFLSKIGFDLVPQYITKQLIENINFAPKSYWFDDKIDLENGDLWMRWFWDDYMTSEYRDKFMQLFIIAIWNPQMDWEDIFNEDNVNNSSNVIDSSKLELYLNTNWYKWFWAFSMMKSNLEKSKQEKNPN